MDGMTTEHSTFPPRPLSAPPGPSRPPWWTQVWVMVTAGGIVMGLALGVRHVQGLFLLPITLDRGWTREDFAVALAVQNLVWGLAQPFAGMVADRWGATRVILAGLLLYALGLATMTLADTPWLFVWTAGVCIGIALSGTSFSVVYGALSRLTTPAQRSQVLGLAGAVGGLAQFALVPLVQGLLSARGWMVALAGLAVTMAVMLPMAFPLDDRQAAASSNEPAMRLGEAVHEAFAQRGFWLLNLGFLACGFQLAFIGTHLPAYLADRGLPAHAAMTALALIAIANVAGTWGCGWLGGRWRQKYLLAGVYLLRALAMALFVLLPLSTWSLYAFAFAMGLLWLGTVPLTNGLLSRIFGVRYLATLFGFVFFGHQLGAFLGVWLGGRMFEATGSYDLIWAMAMGLGVLAALLHWPIDDRQLVRVAPGAAAA